MMTLGVAVILKYGKHFLFEIQKTSKWVQLSNGKFQIGLGCIGGGIEKNETAYQALMREAIEEIECTISLEKSHQPFRFGPKKTIEKIPDGNSLENCQFIWEEEKPGYIEDAHIAVYSGTPMGRPFPGDLPALIGLTPTVFFKLWDHTFTVEEILKEDTIILERTPIPRDAELCPVGTAQILLELEDIAPQLIKSLLNQENQR